MPSPTSRNPDSAERDVRVWLERVVIGLNLCPFAGQPYRNGTVRIVISDSATPDSLLAELRTELQRLDETPATELETTLLVLTKMLAKFDDYNQFLDEVDDLLVAEEWDGIYQVASFHPDYQFAETRPEDAGNLTNRAPWPILHLLREESVERAVESDLNVEAIPARNIAKMESLTAEERRELFPWL
ncbi:MAG: DUF1415 domain-containing protein [Planctomycetota bacterium]|nr:DUF1415 domain-containing protein [Planctomycetota bacterium]